MQTALYIIAAILLIVAFIFIPKSKKTRIFGVSLVACALLLELFVFNFHSLHLVFGNYEKLELDKNSEIVTIDRSEGETVTVTISGIDRPVGTLKINCYTEDERDENGKGFAGTPYVNVRVDAKDSTQQSNFRGAVSEGCIVRGDEDSSYVVMNMSGDVSDIKLKLTAKSCHSLKFESVTLNDPIPFEASVLRLVLIVGSIFAIYALASFPSMLAKYEEKRSKTKFICFILTSVLIFCAVALTFMYQYDKSGVISGGFEQTSGNQITEELVDAFEAGQVSLLDEPSKELLELDNPYDWSERQNKKVSYKWDHLLFDGKYYSYYGIAPVILLFLPYHLATGFYFPTPEAVLLFGALGILFLSLAYLAFCDMFCKKIPVNMVIIGLLICQFSSGVWYNFCSPLFYEIAQASAFCFTCAGFWLLFRSGVIGDGKIKLPSLCLSSVCLSLAVLCRPTTALYCIIALIFIGFGLVKQIKTVTVTKKNKHHSPIHGKVISYLLYALLPFAVIGSVQMLYNYTRFGSFFDFGIQYSLTINDFTRSQYHTDLAVIGFHNYLFAFPQITTEFPFALSNFSDLGLNGYYYIANRNAVGLFWRALPCLAYFAAIPAYKALTKKERLPALLLIIPTCIIAPLVIIFSIWESGYGVRYCADFAWQFILGALAILFLLYARRANDQTKALMQKFFIISLSVAFFINFGMIYSYISKTGHMEETFMSFERIFEFWK